MRLLAPAKLLAIAALALLGACAGSGSQRGAAADARGSAEARPIDPVTETKDWSYANRPGKIYLTPNYRLWTTELDAVIINRLPLFLEESLRAYRTSLGPLPPPRVEADSGDGGGRLDTFILSNRMQWELLTKQIMGERSATYLQIPRGGYASGGRAVFYDIGAAGTMSIAAHEGWHQYTQRTFRDGLPIWLEEGVATYFEGHRWSGARPIFLGWSNTERFDQLRTAAAARKLMPLRDLLDATPQGLLAGSQAGDALTYYAQVWALVHFLREDDGGRMNPAFKALLADAADGRLRRTLAAKLGEKEARAAMVQRRGPSVFEAYFGSDLVTMSQRYDAFVAKIVRTGSRQAVVEGRSPIAP